MSTVSWLEGAGLPATRTELVTRGPQLAVWVLAAALGIQSALIVTHLAGSGSGRRPSAPAATALTVRPPLDVAALGNGHLFGLPPPAAKVDDANAPPTNMPLVLTGIIASTDPSKGMAIIGTSASNAASTRWRCGFRAGPWCMRCIRTGCCWTATG